jgi:hypothetical protein
VLTAIARGSSPTIGTVIGAFADSTDDLHFAGLRDRNAFEPANTTSAGSSSVLIVAMTLRVDSHDADVVEM